MPDVNIQLHYTGAEGDQTLRLAFAGYVLFRRLAQRHSRRPSGDVLDFGVGWGRIIRFFLRDVAPDRLWGVDPVNEMIEVCRETNPWARFALIDASPSTSFPPESFDLVYAYSVFSHLSEDMHLRWLPEIRRILRNGGLFLATTRPREFIVECAELRRGRDSRSWQAGAARAFADAARALSDYDSGGFVYDGIHPESDYFGEACIPRAYADRRWADQFEIVDYVDDRAACIQNVIVARK